MANDRLWLRCEACGGRVLLLKWWGDLGEAWHPGELSAFVTEHAGCVGSGAGSGRGPAVSVGWESGEG